MSNHLFGHRAAAAATMTADRLEYNFRSHMRAYIIQALKLFSFPPHLFLLHATKFRTPSLLPAARQYIPRSQPTCLILWIKTMHHQLLIFDMLPMRSVVTRAVSGRPCQMIDACRGGQV